MITGLGLHVTNRGIWNGKGVFNVEEFDPDPFLEEMSKNGLPWNEAFDIDLEL